jgi:glycosyltransferase involved in cell wall biosynthesis
MRAKGLSLALEINDLATLASPYWVYRDMTWKQVADYGGDTATGVIHPALVHVHRAHEKRVYDRASGVFVFSEWAARGVADVSPSARTVVVAPGANALGIGRRRHSSVPRLLFVGRAFERKGGAGLLEALAVLRQRRDVRLDIVGPPPPLSSAHEGVTFHGPLPPKETAALFSEATLFVMPSQFEAYGIALVEALACGVPCVARAVCAIPEILAEGKWGVLVESADPLELANGIDEALDDEALHDRVEAARDAFRRFYTWDRAALQMLGAMLADTEPDEAALLNAAVPPPP